MFMTICLEGVFVQVQSHDRAETSLQRAVRDEPHGLGGRDVGPTGTPGTTDSYIVVMSCVHDNTCSVGSEYHYRLQKASKALICPKNGHYIIGINYIA